MGRAALRYSSLAHILRHLLAGHKRFLVRAGSGRIDSLVGLFVFGTALTTTAWAVSTLVPSLIAEVAEPEEKSRLVGLGHTAWSTAMVVGSLAGGLLVEVDASLPFFLGAGIAAVGTSCAFLLCRRLDAPAGGS